MSLFQELVSEHGSPLHIAAGEHVFLQGDRCSTIFLVRNGLLKAYYIRADGKEHIKSFQPEGSIIGSMVALIDQEPSTFGLVALEPSDLVSLPYSKLAAAAKESLELSSALISFLSSYGKRKERREYEFLCLSPKDRYIQLLDSSPSLAERISQAELAAYIGVPPQALSRIKRRNQDR